MLMQWKGRRMLIAAVFIFATGLLIFSQSLVPESFNWSDISNSLPLPKTSSLKARPDGHLHFIIAGSKTNYQLCRALLSATVNRYGAPIMAGWNATGQNDAAVTHLAKVRVVTKYLEDLPPTADDDMFLMIDGYDVQLQFGPDVLIERYFKAAALEDERIVQQLGPAHAERVAGPLGRHVFFGADKVCWPVDWKRPACWAVPEVPMDRKEFGPFTDTGDMAFNRPRWLNSGTIMGPIREVRAMFRATLDRINETYDPKFEFKESDQYYMSDVWGEQEVERIAAQLQENPNAIVTSGGPDRFIPEIVPGRKYNYHIAMDYWSLLFQTWAGYTDWVDWRKFDGQSYSFEVNQNVRNNSEFAPWQLHMQADGMKSIGRIFDSTQDETMGNTSNHLILKSQWGSNVITKQTFPMFHCTGSKGALDGFWPRMWFFPHGRALVRAAITAFHARKPFAPYPIDNRMWYPAKVYPRQVTAEGVVIVDDGGAWSDGSDATGKPSWLTFDGLCHDHMQMLFGE